KKIRAKMADRRITANGRTSVHSCRIVYAPVTSPEARTVLHASAPAAARPPACIQDTSKALPSGIVRNVEVPSEADPTFHRSSPDCSAPWSCRDQPLPAGISRLQGNTVQLFAGHLEW